MAELRTPQGHILLLPEGGISVGADPDNEVPVAAQLGLAPVHFRLQPWEGGHFLEDAGSGLGTLVNGHPVNWKPLVHGDTITAGELEVVYHQQATSATGLAPVAVVPPPPPVPVFAQAAKAHQLPFETAPAVPPAAVAPAFEPAAESAPPAWLPADLLPASYLSALPEKSSLTETPAAALQTHPPESAPAWLPSQPRRKSKPRRLFPLAAAFLLLLGAGAFFAWQQGILPQWLKKMEGMGNQPSTGASQTAKTAAPAPPPKATIAPPPAPIAAPPRTPEPVDAPVEIRAAIPVRR